MTKSPETSMNPLKFQLMLAEYATETGHANANVLLEEMLAVYNKVIEAFPDQAERRARLDDALEMYSMAEDAAKQGEYFPAMLPPTLIPVREEAEENLYRAPKAEVIPLKAANPVSLL